MGYNVDCILPRPEFLHALRRLTHESGIVLIFDEVISGFRHGLGGYQKIAGVPPDLTTLGKSIANGYPLAALCGRADLMNHYGPGGKVMFAGTHNAHPVSVAASLVAIEMLERLGSYEHLFGLEDCSRRGLKEISLRQGVQVTVT